MSDERRQLEINWRVSDDKLMVEFNPLQRWLKIQDYITGDVLLTSSGNITDLIEMLQVIQKKMNETEP